MQSTLKKGILQVELGISLSTELFNNKEFAINWFQTPNPLLFNESPHDVCIRGDGKFLITWLKDRLGKA